MKGAIRITNPNQPELSPPQIPYFNQLKYSIGNDPLVAVIDLYELPRNAGYLILFGSEMRRRLGHWLRF